jgi:predicted helicase
VAPLPRLGVYLADTLSEPGAGAPLGRLGFVSAGISDERKAADRVKSQQPILAIIGNPPYRRLEEGEDRTLVGSWMNKVWDDLKAPVRDAGQGNQLNTFPELSVAFWRWAIWKLFESEGAPKRGIVAFITNRKFLTGWPYAGLRRMMRERFDRIEIIDLRGDVRRGPRAGVERDEGVFEIKVGTAITVAIADGSRSGKSAEVFYADSWREELFDRSAKLGWLIRGASEGKLAGAVAIRRTALDDFRRPPFLDAAWPSVSECFKFHRSGMKSGNDALFVGVNVNELVQRVDNVVLSATGKSHDPALVRLLAYRPLDVRSFYNDLPLLDRPGPLLQRVWGHSNVGLYALPGGTAAGPAVWCHAPLPDYHAFRGSYGGYAFPLHDRRPEVAHTNIAPAILDGLAAAYGVVVDPQDVFDAVLCLLTAVSYTLRFAEDLEDVFPHVPFPSVHAVFARAAELGARIRRVETFDPSLVLAALGDPAFVRLTTAPSAGAVLKAAQPDGDKLVLCADGSGSVAGAPKQLWDFEVSGYRVLVRWLEGREGEPMDLALFDAFRDVCARIAELIQLSKQADKILEEALNSTLNRDVLCIPST